jgi:hypothetical protein
MKLIQLITFSTLIVATNCFSALNDVSKEEISKLYNDKEVESQYLSKKELQAFENVDEASILLQKNALYDATYNLIQNFNTRCELKLIDLYKQNLKLNNQKSSSQDIVRSLKVLRRKNHIDDIFLNLLLNINADYNALSSSKNYKAPLRRINSKKTRAFLELNDIKDIYQNFTQWPDETELCVYQQFNFVKFSITTEDNKPLKNKDRIKLLYKMNLSALNKEIISRETYNRLEYLRKDSFIRNRTLRLEDYLEITIKAKNSMVSLNSEYESDDISAEENKFSSKRLKWYKKLTRRTKLYQKYTSTQIVLMSQVIQKASRRMGVDPDVQASTPVITQNFVIENVDGTLENYVEKITLSPQSQFSLARRRMRKDILDLQMMDTFIGKEIFYEEVVMAAFETGYVTIEDLKYVIQYDDLWNPSRTRFEKVLGFIRSVVGVATFFVPPPFNVGASLALTIADGIISNATRKGMDNDNPATFID